MRRVRATIGVVCVAVGLWAGGWVVPQTGTTAPEQGSVPVMDEQAISDTLDTVLASQERILRELEAILEELAIVKIRASRRRS